MLNSGPFETAVFRAQTGGRYNILGAYGLMVTGTSFPLKGAIPIPTGQSGTIVSTGKYVRGTNTRFLSQFIPGDFIYHKDVVRRIDYIETDSFMVLTQGFPTDIAVAEIPLKCGQQFYAGIYAKNTHATTDAILQEANMTPGNTFLNQGAPISYDCTSGGELEFQVHK